MAFIDLITALFTDYTLRNVALGAAILGAVSGSLGCFAMLRKQSLLGDAMSHAALPGVVLVFIFTGLKSSLALFIGALIAALAGGVLLMVTTERTRIKADSALGVVLAVFFGFGMALLSWVQRNSTANQAGLDKFLFGRAAALVQSDVITMAVIGGLAIGILLLLWKEFKLITFDPDFGATIGFPVTPLSGLLLGLIVMGIVVGLQMVGVVLMAAMIVAPAAAARQWTDRLGVMVTLAGLFGAVAGVAGALISSFGRGLSTGPVIVLIISAIVFFSLLFAPNRGIVWAYLRQIRQRSELSTQRVLEVLYLMASSHDNPCYPHSLGSLMPILPHVQVSKALNALQAQGHVQNGVGPNGEVVWSLTPAGLEAVTQLRHDTLATRPGSAAEVLP